MPIHGCRSAYRLGWDTPRLRISAALHLQGLNPLARPEISVILDSDRDAAVVTRRRVLALAAKDKKIVAGMHLHFPGFARVINRGNGFALQKV